MDNYEKLATVIAKSEENDITKEQIDNLINLLLSETEKTIFLEYWGLDDGKLKNFDEVGKIIGKRSDIVRSIYLRVITEFKKIYIKNNSLDLSTDDLRNIYQDWLDQTKVIIDEANRIKGEHGSYYTNMNLHLDNEKIYSRRLDSINEKGNVR